MGLNLYQAYIVGFQTDSVLSGWNWNSSRIIQLSITQSQPFADESQIDSSIFSEVSDSPSLVLVNYTQFQPNQGESLTASKLFEWVFINPSRI